MSPLTERQPYEDRDEQKSGYDAPRRYGPPADARHPDPRRQEGPPSGTKVLRNSPSPAGLDSLGPRFERERLSSLHQKDPVDLSPVPRFESPNSEHSDDGPLDVPHPPPKPILKAPPRGGQPPGVRQHDSPGHTPPHDGGHPPSRYMGPSRPQPSGWYEGGGPGRFDEPQFNGPHHPGPGRFDGGGPSPHGMSERPEGPGQCDVPPMGRVPLRGGDTMGRFDGAPPGPNRFSGPVGQQPPVRYEGQAGAPGHMEGPMQRFEAPGCYNNMGPGPGPGLGPGPMGFQQQRPLHFEGPPNQMGSMRFDNPNRFEAPAQPGPRYDLPNVPLQGGPPRFDYAPGPQGPPRFAPQLNLQPPMRPMGPPVYDNPMAPQQNFGMGPQRFPEPMNPQFPAGPMAFPTQPAGNFNMQPAPFTQPAPGPFFNAAAPTMQQQPVTVMGTMNQPFLPQNSVPYGQQTPQVGPQENHFGQVDVNDLLSKLISTGIIAPSQPEPAQPASETSSVPPAAPPVEEDEEEEQEVEEEDDIPDLTGFSIDGMKQRYENVVTKLYSGNQCCLCSMRFTTAQTDMYADHLDWHFRQNHAGKVASKKVTHRRWYYGLTDWVEFEEIADLEERAKSQFFEKENEEVQKNQAAAKEEEFQSVRATKDQVAELCEICQEPFETCWVEEEEDWFLKNALRVDDKNFHPSCFEDYKNTSSYMDVTPSPSKLLTEHPLGGFGVADGQEEEEEEGGDASGGAAAVLVKQEVKSEPCELLQVKQEEGGGQEVLADCAHSEETA